MMRSVHAWFSAAMLPALLLPAAGLAQVPQVITVAALAKAPSVDGNLADWAGAWTNVPLKPALPANERTKYGLDADGDKNQTGSLTVQVKAGVNGDTFFLAVKYPDSSADTSFKMWEWRDGKYAESKDREDMFAIRFHMSGDFDRSMLSSKDYKVDLWLWSAARTNHAGLAEDMTHVMTTAMQESAAEYALPGGKTAYIIKKRDAGTAPYKMVSRPRENKGDRLSSFEPLPGSGSAADVKAKGTWAAGHWNLEFSRAMSTGQADDVVFAKGQKVLGQLAAFNKGYAEHKSVSEPLSFDFSAVK